MSKHHFRRYPNLAKDFTPLKAHELWVADITYIPTKHRHAYLFPLLMLTAERSWASISAMI
ncbi:MAG: hypothetical protein IPK90_02840 [Chitinophagaceae bacterium]|nr:hypothetical protein [Chitinophagaceae bacterium]